MRLQRRRGRWPSVFAGLAVAVACAQSEQAQGGLMLVISQDGTLELDRLDVNVTAKDRSLIDNTYRLPQEAKLPTTLMIVSNGDPTATATIRVSGWRYEVPLDVRDAIVRQIPTDRVVALDIVLSGSCVERVEVVDGKAVSRCGGGSGEETCDPTTGDCVSSDVNGAVLEPYVPGEERTATGGTGGSATSGGATSGGTGPAGADQGGHGGQADCDMTCAAGAGGCESTCPLACPDDYANCNKLPEDGCEAYLARDVDHCGACDVPCQALPGETPNCVNGACDSTLCEPGFGNCSANPDGICADDLTSDPRNCERCGGVCTVRNGTPACEESTCVVAACDDSYSNCNEDDDDGGYSDGCEANLLEDERNCGACGRVCSVERGSAVCVNGTCGVLACEPGYGNCDATDADGGYADGCETHTASDERNCGGCGEMGEACEEFLADRHAIGQCVSGECRPDDCFDNFENCDDIDSNGCEADLRSDEDNCGDCERLCLSDGTVGGLGNVCTAGDCVPECDTNHLDCDRNGRNGCEVDRRTDEQNCGVCERECLAEGGTNSCTSGTCVPGCDGENLDCNGNPDDGCETPCSNAGTLSRSCTGLACAVTCDAAHLTCDNNQANGCEIARSVANCAACGQVCLGTNAVATACTNGVCDPVCSPGWGACTNPQDGCTTRLDADPFCGSCSGDCAGDTPDCVASGTTYRCHGQITFVNSASASSVGSILSFSHALQQASSRLILLGVVAEAGGNGVVGATPSTVRYGGTDMVPGPVQAGSNQTADPGFWSPDLFFYYLGESAIANKTGNQTVAIDASPGSVDPQVMAAFLIEVAGASQSEPIAASSGAIALAAAAPPTIASTVSVATAGSHIFSLAGAVWSSLPVVNLVPASELTVLAPPPEVESSTRLRASATYVGGTSASTLAPNNYTVTYTYSSPHSRTHMAVVIRPIQQP